MNEVEFIKYMVCRPKNMPNGITDCDAIGIGGYCSDYNDKIMCPANTEWCCTKKEIEVEPICIICKNRMIEKYTGENICKLNLDEYDCNNFTRMTIEECEKLRDNMSYLV